MTNFNRSINITKLLEYLERSVQHLPPTMGERLAEEYNKDPFILLIGCLLSLRARDSVVYPVCQRLFLCAKNAEEMVLVPIPVLENILHPIGFHRTKAMTIHRVCYELTRRCHGRVPFLGEALLSLPGVGRKTANFVLCYAYEKPAICVDTHVHRLANQFSLVRTATPEETELALQQLVPKEWWCRLNSIFVRIGQNKKLMLKALNEVPRREVSLE